MELNDEVRIPAKLEYVYNCLNDLEVLQKCIPGCEELSEAEDETLLTKVVLKLVLSRQNLKERSPSINLLALLNIPLVEKGMEVLLDLLRVVQMLN